MDWAQWSRDAVALMSARSRKLIDRHGPGTSYRWDLESARFVLGSEQLQLIVVGTVADDSFLWAWASDEIPPAARENLEAVREVGRQHGLALLTQPRAPGGLAQGKECLAIAGRVLDAAAIWVDKAEAGHILFALRRLT